MKTTEHFEEDVRREHPEANRLDWIRQVLDRPSEQETQPDGRIRRWAYIEEAGRWMRVVTLADGETVHTAFFDRGYARRQRGQT